MKKKKDLKKLALMGMATGMLLSPEQASANFSNDETLMNALAYVAAKCGAKCGGAVAASCSSHNGCSSAVAERTPYGYYYQNSCNSYQQFQHQGCSSYAPAPGQHGCSSSYGSHGCSSGSPQGYYDPSQWSANQGQPNSTQPIPKGAPNQNNGKYADNSKNSNSKGGQNNQNSDKWQASSGCAGNHKCNNGPDNGGKFQANGCSANRSNNNNSAGNYYQNQVAAADTHVNPPKLNEADLLSKLNAQGKATYNTLTPEGKKLALELANQDCKGKNSCKGLNSCKTDKNDCAGKGGCRGTSPGAFTDKNVAVKVAAAKMAEKRNGLQNNNGK